jgi:biopolymer transport protein ExbD
VNIRRQKKGPVTETQMVSLADIAFLIIFFFMLSSSFMKDRTAIDLPNLPKAAQTESDINVTLDAAGDIFLDGDKVGSPEALEGRLKDKLAGRTKAEECEVRFKCDKNQTHKTYHPIYQAIANAGGVIAIMHEVRN